jgi:DNA recombination protein RmuC
MLWRRKTEMTVPALLIALQTLIAAAVVFLLLRRAGASPPDARLLQLPDQLTRLDARSDALATTLRDGLSDLRRETSDSSIANREAAARDFSTLRSEIATSISTLGNTLQNGLADFRADNKSSADALSAKVQQQLDAIARSLTGFISEAARAQLESRDALNTRLNELSTSAAAQQEKLRLAVEDRLEKLNATNAAKLEEMRVTVDEKLQATLQTRLTESFGQVTTHLGEVQKGLGEMKVLATGVGDLKKVLSNVSRRGGVGEFLVGQQLEQMFSPEQYLKQVNIKPDTAEKVDFALKFPNGELGSFVLLPIDAKFPTSDWERLEHAYEHGSAEEIADAGKAFERSIRVQGKSICEKYIDPPTTMPHAIMVLPTEALYAEVARRPGLQSELQSNCRVTIAGPSTFMAILTSFQMGFHTLAIQKKGDEVWRVLSSTRNEFEKFGGMMDKVRKQVDTVQNTLGEIGGKTKTINRTLKNVSSVDTGAPLSNLLGFEEIAAVAPRIAAATEE